MRLIICIIVAVCFEANVMAEIVTTNSVVAIKKILDGVDANTLVAFDCDEVLIDAEDAALASS